MRLAWHVAFMSEKNNGYRVLIGKSEGNKTLGRPSLGGRVILKWILQRYDGVVCIAVIRLGVGISARLL
jgi:hypothetical protein